MLKYYAKVFLPLALVLGLFYILKFHYYHSVGLLFGYMWVVAFYAPELRERSKTKKYSKSFVRAFYWINDWVIRKFKMENHQWMILSTLPSAVFFVVHALLGSVQIPIFPLIGSLLFLALRRKMHLAFN